MIERLPLALMLVGLLALVCGIAGQFGIWWALMAAGVGLIALAVNEVS